MSFANQQYPHHQRLDYTFPNTGPPVFRSGPDSVFSANAATPYRLHSPQPSQQQSQAQSTPPPLTAQPGQYQTGPYRSLKGLWDGTNWLCNCNPRKVTVKFQVKKESSNKGRWFYRCGNTMGNNGPDKCSLFLWEDDQEVQKRQSHPESDPSGPVNTANAYIPTLSSQQPNVSATLQQTHHIPSKLTFGNSSATFAQGSSSASGLTTPAITPSKRHSSGPFITNPTYRAPSPYSSPLHSPPGSPTTFSQRLQPPRQAKSPNGKSVAFDDESEDSSTEYDSETNTSTTESFEDDDNYETESWEDDTAGAQTHDDAVPTHNYYSDSSLESDDESEDEDEDEYEVETQLNRDMYQFAQHGTNASFSQPRIQPIPSKAPVGMTTTASQTQYKHLTPSETSDSEQELFVTPRSSVEPTTRPTITAETTTTTTVTGPYTATYHHPPPRPPQTPPSHRTYRPTTPTTPKSAPNPALTASPMPTKGALTNEILTLLSDHSIVLPASCKTQLESLLERQYRRESASLKAKERLRMIIQEKERDIERLQNELAEIEINADLVPVFTKTSLVTEKKTDRTYYRRRSEAEKLV